MVYASFDVIAFVRPTSFCASACAADCASDAPSCDQTDAMSALRRATPRALSDWACAAEASNTIAKRKRMRPPAALVPEGRAQRSRRRGRGGSPAGTPGKLLVQRELCADGEVVRRVALLRAVSIQIDPPARQQ